MTTVKPGRTPSPVRVDLGSPAPLGKGVTVKITRIESVEGEGRGIGEVGGPAVRLTVRVQNNGPEPISLDLALITVYYGGTEEPASDLSSPGVERLPSTLESGGTATGKYVYAVPKDRRDRLRVDFSYEARSPVAVFRGSADERA